VPWATLWVSPGKPVRHDVAEPRVVSGVASADRYPPETAAAAIGIGTDEIDMPTPYTMDCGTWPRR
jgi:hypothetical protein